MRLRGPASSPVGQRASTRPSGAVPLNRLPNPIRALRLAQWASALAGCLALASAAALRADEPYRNLRDTTLEYNGPAEAFTNLTELRLGWFGPSDLADPLTGDIWFAATLAIDEANAAASRSGTPCSPPDSSPGGGAGFTPAIESKAELAGVKPAPPSRITIHQAQRSDCTGELVSTLSPPSTLDARPSTEATRLSTPPSLPFRLVPCWAPDPWRAGVSLLTRMVYDEQPLALLGSVDSASTHLAEQIVAKAQLPLVSPFTTDKSITLAGVAWMFTCAPSDTAIASTLVDAVLAADQPDRGGLASHCGTQGREMGLPSSVVSPAGQSEIENLKSKILLLSSTDHESRLTAREVMREFSLRKRLPNSRFELTPGLPLPPKVLAAFEQSAPTIIVLVANAEDSARWLITLRERFAARPPAGAAAPVFFGSHSLGRSRFRELAGPVAEGVQFPLLWNPDTATPEAGSFLERFRAARGHSPDYTAVYTYDATRLLIAAIRRAGPNRARIRESLLGLSPWTGLGGTMCFDGTGQNTRGTLALGTIRGGVVLPLPPEPLQPPLSP